MSTNVQKNGHLTPKQYRAIEALLSGHTKGQAAAAAGVTTKTLSRWRAIPAFDGELRHQSSQAISDAGRRLIGGMGLAVYVLVALAANKEGDVPYSVRLSASRAILDAGMRLQELTDIEQRISELEERLK